MNDPISLHNLPNINILYQFYQQQIMPQHQLQTDLERRFLSTTLYKRSKHYFDINRLNRLEQKLQISRRIPRQRSIESIDGKVEESFFSAQTRINERVQTQLQFLHKKCLQQDKDDSDTNYSLNEYIFDQLRKKGTALDMNKMLPRKYFQKQKNSNGSQSQFCNFQPYQPPTNHTIDFTKYVVPTDLKRTNRKKIKSCFKCSNKDSIAQNQQSKQLESQNLGKIHEKLWFDQSIFKTLTDYNKYDKEKSQTKENKKELEVPLQRIYNAQELTRKKPKGCLVEFYNGTNKWETSQMETRLAKQNEQFLQLYNKHNQKNKDWAVIKRKTDLISKRRMQIMGRKHIKDVKGEICDEIYFRRNEV